ncbi:MAG: hypothetical protein RIQ69_1930, partial [Pseudomonadota bacterium]
WALAPGGMIKTKLFKSKAKVLEPSVRRVVGMGSFS